jgi:hypothetical protein
VGLGGVKAWRWHLEELGWGGGAAGSGEWRWQCGRAWAAQEVEETADMQGPLVSDMRERERERAPTAGILAEWAERGGGSLRRKAGQHKAGWACWFRPKRDFKWKN